MLEAAAPRATKAVATTMSWMRKMHSTAALTRTCAPPMQGRAPAARHGGRRSGQRRRAACVMNGAHARFKRRSRSHVGMKSFFDIQLSARRSADLSQWDSGEPEKSGFKAFILR
eukprot:6203628-Pleurochrysis_carterae.AAC.1